MITKFMGETVDETLAQELREEFGVDDCTKFVPMYLGSHICDTCSHLDLDHENMTGGCGHMHDVVAYARRPEW